ncbi:MAG: hypothetical protein AAFV53_14770 [Myxococcota bacterium]
MMFALLLFAPYAANAGTSSVFVSAEKGGHIKLDDLTVTIPAGALDTDTMVTLKASDPVLSKSVPSIVLPLSRQFSVDLGSAELKSDFEVAIDLPEAVSFDIIEDAILSATVDDEGEIRLSLPKQESKVARFATDDVTFWLAVVPKPDQGAKPLQVPFYIQDGISWCTPTALSMLFGYHKAPATFLSNWEMAGIHGQDRNNGLNNNVLMRSLMSSHSFTERDYDFYYWDDDFINADGDGRGVDNPLAFEMLELTMGSYLVWQNNGYNIQDIVGETYRVGVGGASIEVSVPDVTVPARPVQLSASTMLNHAFMVVGSDIDAGVRIHDSSGAAIPTAGADIAAAVSWEEVAETMMTEDVDDNLRSIVLNTPPRPAPERRGSLIVRGGRNSSLRYESNDGQLANWWWDGSPYANGSYWDDREGSLSTAVGGDALRPGGALDYDIGAANVTSSTQTYTLQAKLILPDGTVKTRSHDSTLGALDYVTNGYRGTFKIEPETKSGVAILQLLMYQGGLLIDFKWAWINIE